MWGMLQNEFDSHDSDEPQNASSYPTIPIAATEVTIYDTTRVEPGRFQMSVELATGAKTKSCLHIKGANLAIFGDQIVTIKVYWMIGGQWRAVNGTAGAGNATTANVAFTKFYPFGGDDTKITYTTGATPPTTLGISNRLSKWPTANAMP
jgi:hypothetical protein